MVERREMILTQRGEENNFTAVLNRLTESEAMLVFL